MDWFSKTVAWYCAENLTYMANKTGVREALHFWIVV